MAFAESYRRQVALLVRTLPQVAEEACFALKGGTAINLFVCDMPRLSVDIDLTYLPVEPRGPRSRTHTPCLARAGQETINSFPHHRAAFPIETDRRILMRL